MADETNVHGTDPITAPKQEKTFTQAELDRVIQDRLAREREKYPSEDELNAYRTWKDGQQTERERQTTRDKELADSRNALTAAQSELEQLRRDKYVLSKGLTGDEAEFIAFKATKLVDDKTTFEQAVDQLIVNRQKVTFDWAAPAGGGSSKEATVNAAMNSLIRGAIK